MARKRIFRKLFLQFSFFIGRRFGIYIDTIPYKNDYREEIHISFGENNHHHNN